MLSNSEGWQGCLGTEEGEAVGGILLQNREHGNEHEVQQRADIQVGAHELSSLF